MKTTKFFNRILLPIIFLILTSCGGTDDIPQRVKNAYRSCLYPTVYSKTKNDSTYKIVVNESGVITFSLEAPDKYSINLLSFSKKPYKKTRYKTGLTKSIINVRESRGIKGSICIRSSSHVHLFESEEWPEINGVYYEHSAYATFWDIIKSNVEITSECFDDSLTNSMEAIGYYGKQVYGRVDIWNLETGELIYEKGKVPDKISNYTAPLVENEPIVNFDYDIVIYGYDFSNRRLHPIGQWYFNIDEINYGDIRLSQLDPTNGEIIAKAKMDFPIGEEKDIESTEYFYDYEQD